MSDVRRELLDAICESYKEVYERPIFPPYAENLADAILGRLDKFERVRRFAAAANAVHQHKNDVLGRDTISLPEVEKLNARLDPLYAEMEAAWCALQPGDLGGEGGE